MKTILTDDYLWAGQTYSASPEAQEIPDDFAIALGLDPKLKKSPAKEAPKESEEK